MKQLPTAEEFLNDKFKEIYYKQPEGLTSNLSETRFLELHVTGRINGVEKNYPEMMIEFAKLQNEELQMRVKELERMVELEYIRRLNGVDDEKKLKYDWEEYKSNFLK